MQPRDFFFLYHKPFAPIGFIEPGFFIVTPQMFIFSLEYVENEEMLIAAKASNAYKYCKSCLRTVWQQFG